VTQIEVSTFVAASPERVWTDVSDLASHVEWMADAERITFTSPERSGVGTAFDCLTKVGPIRLTDRMVVTEWEAPAVIGIRHVGVVTGAGRLTMAAEAYGTRFRWTETLTFPWYLGGRIGSAIGGPLVLRRIWKRNLERFRRRF
jgi:hypothetical protein